MEEKEYRGIRYKICSHDIFGYNINLIYFDIILNAQIIDFLGGENENDLYPYERKNKKLYKSSEYPGQHFITSNSYDECVQDCRKIIDKIISFYNLDSKCYEQTEREFNMIEN
jgi:hypothetical protein